MKEVLADRLEELEEKETRLEEKELQQELLIEELKKEKLISSVQEQLDGKSTTFPRTCRELRALDPSVPSGMNWIDPDGQEVGDAPIYVYCDMTKGKFTIISSGICPIIEKYLKASA